MWCDGPNGNYKKPTPLPAPVYINLLMDWIEEQINNEQLFPGMKGCRSERVKGFQIVPWFKVRIL